MDHLTALYAEARRRGFDDPAARGLVGLCHDLRPYPGPWSLPQLRRLLSLRWQYAHRGARDFPEPTPRRSVRSPEFRIRDTVPIATVRKVAGKCMAATCRALSPHPVHP